MGNNESSFANALQSQQNQYDQVMQQIMGIAQEQQNIGLQAGLEYNRLVTEAFQQQCSNSQLETEILRQAYAQDINRQRQQLEAAQQQEKLRLAAQLRRLQQQQQQQQQYSNSQRGAAQWSTRAQQGHFTSTSSNFGSSGSPGFSTSSSTGFGGASPFGGGQRAAEEPDVDVYTLSRIQLLIALTPDDDETEEPVNSVAGSSGINQINQINHIDYEADVLAMIDGFSKKK